MALLVEKYACSLKVLNAEGVLRFASLSLVECDDCKQTRLVRLDDVKRGKGLKYCRSCCRKGDRNHMNKHPIKLMSDITRMKISKATSGTNNPFFGRHHTEKSKELLRKKRIGIFIGEKSPRWNPNLTQEERAGRRYCFKLREWRSSVFERDGYKCQITSKVGGKLEAHHIYNWSDFPEKRFDIGNGITLSKEIHSLFHKIFGRSMNTLEQLETFKNDFYIGKIKV